MNIDQQLLLAYKNQGDIQSLGKLYNEYMELVYGLCMKYLKNKADSEDAVMGIYELVSEKLKTQEVDNFKSWLYVVTKNYCLDKLRKKKRNLTKEKELYFMQSATFFHPDEVNESENQFKLLEECIEKLPDTQRKMIQLFYYHKISYQQIVEKEQMTWNMVRSKIQNGRRNLKQCIEANG